MFPCADIMRLNHIVITMANNHGIMVRSSCNWVLRSERVIRLDIQYQLCFVRFPQSFASSFNITVIRSISTSRVHGSKLSIWNKLWETNVLLDISRVRETCYSSFLSTYLITFFYLNICLCI